MLQLKETVTISRSPGELFGLAADPETQIRWDRAGLRSCQKLTPGPLSVGTRYRGKFARFGTVEYELAEFEPGHRFARDTHNPFGDIHHVFELEEVPGGTRLTQRMELEPHGLGRVMAPLAKPLLQRRMRTIDRELKEYAERAD